MTNIGECYQVHPSRTSKQLYLLDILVRALSELLTQSEAYNKYMMSILVLLKP